MEIYEAIRGAGTCRYYRPDPVPDAVLARVLDAARYGPSGGNRQPVRLVAVRDPASRRALRDLYLPHWERYLELARSGATRIDALPEALRAADDFARGLHEIPVLVVVCARLADVHPTDDALGRLSVVGGASIYPALQNLLLACRAEGLGAALTTLLCREEPRVKALLDVPEDFATCAHVAVGWPEGELPRSLRRRPLEELAFQDRFGAPLPGATGRSEP